MNSKPYHNGSLTAAVVVAGGATGVFVCTGRGVTGGLVGPMVLVGAGIRVGARVAVGVSVGGSVAVGLRVAVGCNVGVSVGVTKIVTNGSC